MPQSSTLRPLSFIDIHCLSSTLLSQREVALRRSLPLPTEVILAIINEAFDDRGSRSCRDGRLALYRCFLDRLLWLRGFASTCRILRSIMLDGYLRPVAVQFPFDCNNIDRFVEYLISLRTGKGLWIWIDLEFTVLLVDCEVVIIRDALRSRWHNVQVLDIAFNSADLYFDEAWMPIDELNIPPNLNILRCWSTRVPIPYAIESYTLRKLRLCGQFPLRAHLPVLEELHVDQLKTSFATFHAFLLTFSGSSILSQLYISGNLFHSGESLVQEVVALPALSSLSVLLTRRSLPLPIVLGTITSSEDSLREWSPHLSLPPALLTRMVRNVEDIWIKQSPSPDYGTAARVVGRHLVFHIWPCDAMFEMLTVRLIPSAFNPTRLFIEYLSSIPYSDSRLARAIRTYFGSVEEVHIRYMDTAMFGGWSSDDVTGLESLHRDNVKVFVHGPPGRGQLLLPPWVIFDETPVVLVD